MDDIRLQTADDFDQMAQELEMASRHAKTAAFHLRQGDVPRYAAHAWAVHGHIRSVQSGLDKAAIIHSTKAKAEP